MEHIGRTWISLHGQGVLAGVASLARMTKQVTTEGRLGEVAVNLGREFASPHMNPIVWPCKPLYAWHGERIVAEQEGPLRLLPLTDQLSGVCHASADGARIWAWAGNSLLAMDSDTGATEEVHRFSRRITAMHSTTRGELLVALRGSLHLSADGGARFSEVLRLSHDWSRVLPRALAEDRWGRLLVGEYGNARDTRGRWQSTAWIHWSDDGSTWRSSDHLIQVGVNKHVHVVAACPFTGRLYLTSGDNHKWLWTQEARGAPTARGDDLSDWTLVGRAPWRLGGYTAYASTEVATYWGTDYWMGTNFVVADYRDGGSIKWMLGPPLRRNPISQMAAMMSDNGNHVVAKSTNKSSRPVGASAILALNEAAHEWMTLLADTDAEKHQAAIAQCSAERGASWIHIRLGRRSFMLCAPA